MALLTLLTASAVEPLQNSPPEGWVALQQHSTGIRCDIRYHTANNFTGAPLPGYGLPGAWLRQGPAEALATVQSSLEQQGLGLLVYDAYRPLRGTLGMVAWAHRTDQVHLLDNGYIARRSGHNKGNTIDLTIVSLTTGEPLDMGTPWDTLSEASHTTNAIDKALTNRQLLQKEMGAAGWKNYWKEWWHYSFPTEEELPHRDVPYACFEAAEKAWVAPEGWQTPGYVMPATITPSPCPRAPGANPSHGD
jgi:D-alanyl-D-alanine dipeptidase